jgi:putative DNA primase/helicase
MTGDHHPYIQAAIDGETARVANSTEGERNENLFKAAASLASLGLLEGEIIRYLKPAAESTGLRGKEFYSTVKSGVKRGSASPRTVPGSSPLPLHIMAPRLSTIIKLPERSSPDPRGDRPAFFVGGDAGPSASGDDIRRHIYRRGGKSVRMKIKRVSGYVSWYRAVDGDREGWQAGKPDGYVPCPYVGTIDPFDPQRTDSTVYWPEGEKDCDTLGSVGLPAFSFGGTGDGLPEGASEYLRNRHVVILSDNDARGQQHGLRKAAVAYPVARTVKVVEFPELAPRNDVSDYLQLASVSDLERRASGAPLWMPPANAPEGGWRSSVISASDLKTKIFSPV